MRFTKTVYSNHPRTFIRDTDVTDLRNRSNDYTRWKQRWDDDWLPSALSTEATKTASQIASNTSNGAEQNMQLAIVSLVEQDTSMEQLCIDAAVDCANNRLGLYTGTNRRFALELMVAAFDLHYSALTAGEKSALVTGINSVCAAINAGLDWDTRMDGHSPGNAAFMLMGGLALDGDHASSTTYINNGLDFWFGATADGKGTTYFWRYFGQDGGTGKGGSYSHLGLWYALQYYKWLHNGFVRNADTPNALQLDSEDYAPWEDETWVQQIGEWLVHNLKGSDDRWQLHDTDRTNPWYHKYWRMAVASLVGRGGSWRPVMRWLHDRLHAKSISTGGYNPGSSSHAIKEFYLIDPGDSSEQPQDPDSAGIARSKFFYPPGIYSCRHPVFDPRQSCQIVSTLQDRYFKGHNHLKVGGIQIDVAADAVLLNSGYYDDWQSNHASNWAQQSISCSGVPLVEGENANGDMEHYSRDTGGARATFPISEGGQCWMTDDGTINGDYGPDNVYDLQYAGSGNMWKKADDTRMVYSDSNYDFVYCDFRRAYLKVYTDYDTSAERVKACELKMVTIKDVHPWPIVLRALRVESRLPTMKKRDHWHFHSAPAWEGDTSQGKFRGYGLLGTGYCSVHYYRPSNFTYSTTGGGSQVNGWGSYDFYVYAPGSSLGTNWPPTESAGSRYQPYAGHYRMEVTPATPTTETWFVCLLIPGATGDALPAYTWLTEENYFGVAFGNTEYRISKNSVQAVRGAQDTTPPDVPTGVAAATGPGSGEVTVSWLPNTDDAYLYRTYYRTKA